MDLACRCRGNEPDEDYDYGRCENPATGEDGLCDDCRCRHGCCEDHTSETFPACAEARYGKKRATLD